MPLRDLLQTLRDTLFPRHCVVCHRTLLPHEPYLCSSCLVGLPYTNYRGQTDNSVMRLFYNNVHIEHGTAFIYYAPGMASRHILLAMKYGQQPQIGRYFGRIMAEELLSEGFFDGVDALVPIPLARKRQRRRGYNQSEWLCRGLSDVTGLPVWADVVKRTKDNPTQTRLHGEERKKNVEGIFQCTKSAQLQGRHVLIVDDVVTTGATVASCIAAMQAAANVRCSVLALAQAANRHHMPGVHLPDFDL